MLKHPARPATASCPTIDERAELAPRDVVARAIDHEIKRARPRLRPPRHQPPPPEFVREHFPNIHEKLLELGIDITSEPIPVVPAQHYTCGGVVIDLDGRTDLPGLYAAGEVTPVGPARRQPARLELACSNASCSARRRRGTSPRTGTSSPQPPPIRAWDESRVTDSDEEVVIKQNWTEIRRFMWNYRRHRPHHQAARARPAPDQAAAPRRSSDYYGHFRVTPDLIELRNLLQVADLIVRSAPRAPRKPRPALHARLSRRPGRRGGGHGAGALAAP